MKAKHFSITVLILTLLCLVIYALPVIIIDPYFHYHEPLESLQYPIDNERYQNSGILKHFSYDTIITGSSMTENFKTSECNAIFDVEAVKVPFSGGTYKEVNDHVKIGLENNPDVKYVIRGLDYSMMTRDKDSMKYDNTPEYLHDSNPFNDVQYFWNKEIFDKALDVLEYTRKDNKTTTFDDYVNWHADAVYGKEAVLATFDKLPSAEEGAAESVSLSDEEKDRILGNARQNVTALPEQYPDVEFYYFITPYNVTWWGAIEREGKLSWWIEAEQLLIEECLHYDNIKLFSFSNDFALTCNLDVYKDQAHYSGEINTEILQRMHAGSSQLTKDNYKGYLRELQEFYGSYDYDSLYE